MARTTSLDSEIRARIDSFLEELSRLVKQSAVEAVRDALGQGDAPARRGPGRPPKVAAPAAGRARRGRPAGGGKRSSEDLDATCAQILAHVRANAGQGAEQIGKALGLSTKEMRLPIQKLIDQGSIRTQGQRRGTKYFAGGRGAGSGARKAKAARKGGRKGARKGRRKAGRRASASSAEPQALAAAAR